MIDVHHLTKRRGRVPVVDDLTFRVAAGRVTGLVGPNGAGKTTTMRIALGLETPSSGTVTFGGVRYRDLPTPLRAVGSVLDSEAFHPGRSAGDHLAYLAVANAIVRTRVAAVLDQTGLASVARRRVGGFSLGMRQRLCIAAALLGDPPVLVLDEPTNGLDPEGVVWLRGLLRGFAAEGRTVLLSSHLMSEMALVADQLILIGRGRLIADLSVRELVEAETRPGQPEPSLEAAYLGLTGRAADAGPAAARTGGQR